MIEPLQHFPAEGVIWYQGESNTSGETVQHNYSKLLSLFLQHWRQGSKQPSFKSILVPITGFGAENQAAELNHQWCDIRQQIIDLGQQDLTWAIPSHDTGQVNNVHPINKSDLAQRAALAAMQQDPDLFIKPTVTAHLHNGRWELTSRQPWFIQRKTRETLGPQQKQHQGSAVGFSVVTFQDDVQNIEGSLLPSGNIRLQHFNDIKTIRYAWSGNPVDANLLDDKGFPIQPFKIDVAQ
jgi:sialate O-acetylesterase